MTAGTTSRIEPADLAPLQAGSLEARASTVLKALAFINVAGMLIAIQPQSLPQSLLMGLVLNLAAAALAAVEIVLARALDRRRPWAVALVRPLLILLVVAGIAATLVGAQSGITRLPFEAVFAIWAMLGPRDDTLVGTRERRSLAGLASVALLVVAILGRQAIFGWGGLLDAQQSDFSASINAECGPPQAGLPAAVTVTYTWSWARTSPLPSGLDILVFAWDGRDASGRQIYYDDDPLAPITAGIYPGRHDYPSEDMAAQVASASKGSWSWGIELGEQRMRPGTVVMHLVRAKGVQAAAGRLAVTASYVHLGVWHSDPLNVSCSWSSPSASIPR